MARGSRRATALSWRRLDLREPGDQRRLGRQRHALGGATLQDLAQLADLLDLLCAEIAHRRAAIGLARHDADVLELGQRLAHRMTLGVEALHQHVLDQPLARLQPPEQDVELERAHEVARRRSRASRLRLRLFRSIGTTVMLTAARVSGDDAHLPSFQ